MHVLVIVDTGGVGALDKLRRGTVGLMRVFVIAEDGAIGRSEMAHAATLTEVRRARDDRAIRPIV